MAFNKPASPTKAASAVKPAAAVSGKARALQILAEMQEQLPLDDDLNEIPVKQSNSAHSKSAKKTTPVTPKKETIMTKTTTKPAAKTTAKAAPAKAPVKAAATKAPAKAPAKAAPAKKATRELAPHVEGYADNARLTSTGNVRYAPPAGGWAKWMPGSPGRRPVELDKEQTAALKAYEANKAKEAALKEKEKAAKAKAKAAEKPAAKAPAKAPAKPAPKAAPAKATGKKAK